MPSSKGYVRDYKTENGNDSQDRKNKRAKLAKNRAKFNGRTKNGDIIRNPKGKDGKPLEYAHKKTMASSTGTDKRSSVTLQTAKKNGSVPRDKNAKRRA